MRFIFRCLSTAVLCCLYFNSFAQFTTSSINGRVFTENQIAGEGASVVLLKFRDSTIVNATTVKKGGEFRFAGLQPDNYLLQISKLGFKKIFAGPYLLASNKALAIADIALVPITKQLNEVTVVSNKPVIEFRPGVVTFNVQNSLSAAGNSVYELLRQSPGVKVDGNDNVSIVGKQTALITIDGKPTNLTGEDLTGVLKSMQANTIEKIELVTSGSAKYDAAGGGIIDIVLKKGKNIGFNATVTGTAGYGKYYKANGGVVFNNRSEKFNVFGSFNTVNNKSFHDFVTDRVIDYNNVISDYHVDYNGILNNHSNNFSFGTDFFFIG